MVRRLGELIATVLLLSLAAPAQLLASVQRRSPRFSARQTAFAGSPDESLHPRDGEGTGHE